MLTARSLVVAAAGATDVGGTVLSVISKSPRVAIHRAPFERDATVSRACVSRENPLREPVKCDTVPHSFSPELLRARLDPAASGNSHGVNAIRIQPDPESRSRSGSSWPARLSAAIAM